MKLKFNLLMMLAVVFMAACGDDDPVIKTPAEEAAGKYDGYSVTKYSYSTIPATTATESFTLVANSDGTGTLTFNSKVWGNYSIPDAVVVLKNDAYEITGSGTVSLSMNGNDPVDRDYTLAGTISADLKTVSLVFTLPQLMGGTTVTFLSGEAPVNMVIAGNYDGYTSAKHQYISEPVITAEESVTFTANEDGTCTVLLESKGAYGKWSIPAATINLANGTYTIEGTGTASIGMETPRDYDCTIEGTISEDGETMSLDFKAEVMGGLTVTFQLGAVPAE